jgi:hypothetical protein
MYTPRELKPATDVPRSAPLPHGSDASDAPAASLDAVVARVQAALAGAGNLRAALGELRDATSAHAADLEGGQAPYSDSVFSCGRYTEGLRSLWEHYQQLSHRAEELCATDPIAQSRVEELCTDLIDLEHQDTEMVFDALWTDIGVGD